MAIPGKTIRGIREALGMTGEVFANLLGVSIVTVYRWEAAAEAPVDGIPGAILQALLKAAPLDKVKKWRELGEKVREALVSRGNLAAIHVLTTHLVDKEKT